MCKKLLFVLPLILCVITTYGKCQSPEASRLQELSVTINSGSGEGSGTLITKDDTTFILTAAHVVANLRSVRSVIDKDGKTKQLIEFKNAALVKEYREDGRRVGETRMDVKVVKYSDADHGDDIAILMVVKKNFSTDSAIFDNTELVPVGTLLWHCGSLLGQMGANSVTTGVQSQIGKMYEGEVYDSTTCTAFPGSSGGGVFKQDGDKWLLVGMITRGSGETFNLMVPMRRIRDWSQKTNMEWLFDPKGKVPSEDELKKMPIEDEGSTSTSRGFKIDTSLEEIEFHFWYKNIANTKKESIFVELN